MRAYGDIESVNLGTGEKKRRVVGDGDFVLEYLGIPGLKPVDPALLADYEKEFEESIDRSKRGGLIMPPLTGCCHDWQPHSLHVNANGHCGSISVKKCSKCYVLGDP